MQWRAQHFYILVNVAKKNCLITINIKLVPTRLLLTLVALCSSSSPSFLCVAPSVLLHGAPDATTFLSLPSISLLSLLVRRPQAKQLVVPLWLGSSGRIPSLSELCTVEDLRIEIRSSRVTPAAENAGMCSSEV